MTESHPNGAHLPAEEPADQTDLTAVRIDCREKTEYVIYPADGADRALETTWIRVDADGFVSLWDRR